MPVITDEMSEDELAKRKQLQIAYQALYKEGLYEGTDNHQSLSLKGLDCMLVLPYGILWDNVQIDDFSLIAFDGTILRHSKRLDPRTGKPLVPLTSAITLHAPIHKKLGEDIATAVFHHHSPSVVAMCCSEKNYELLMIHQNACRFFN